MKENWKDIKGYENRYQVSDLGKVKSVRYNRLRKFTNDRGYLKITLPNPIRTFRVNRLVAIAFIPNPKNKPEVNHKNGNKKDNRKINLAWSTEKENMQHAIKLGLRKTGIKYGRRFSHKTLVKLQEQYKCKTIQEFLDKLKAQ